MDESVQKHLKPDLDDASNLLLKAARYIDEHGLSCGGQVDRYGRNCTVVVLSKLGGDTETESEALRRIRKAIMFTAGHDGIGKWSDTTPAPVVSALLRRVALGG